MAGRSFREQVKQDLKAVFHTPEEHAEMTPVVYDGREYLIPVVIDHEGARDRYRPGSDHAEGIFVTDAAVYLSSDDLEIMPRKETSITIGDTEYTIVKVGCDVGEITLELEVLDE